MYRTTVVLLSCVSVVYSAGGGMAELKSITGDAPYLGGGNAPAFIPQPQGFWGRARYSPFGGYGGGYGGGFGGSPYGNDVGFGRSFGYGPDRFTSRSGSPFAESGFPRREEGFSILRSLMGLFDDESSPSLSSRAFSSSSSLSSFTPSSSRTSLPFASSFSSPSSSSIPSSSSVSLSSATGGGFYNGRGNDFAN